MYLNLGNTEAFNNYFTPSKNDNEATNKTNECLNDAITASATHLAAANDNKSAKNATVNPTADPEKLMTSQDKGNARENRNAKCAKNVGYASNSFCLEDNNAMYHKQEMNIKTDSFSDIMANNDNSSNNFVQFEHNNKLANNEQKSSRVKSDFKLAEAPTRNFTVESSGDVCENIAMDNEIFKEVKTRTRHAQRTDSLNSGNLIFFYNFIFLANYNFWIYCSSR